MKFEIRQIRHEDCDTGEHSGAQNLTFLPSSFSGEVVLETCSFEKDATEVASYYCMRVLGVTSSQAPNQLVRQLLSAEGAEEGA